ncbi:MAG TPA: cytochrome c [Azoarcus sp.]|nr:cytochrome c [Azoarcus sp.]
MPEMRTLLILAFAALLPLNTAAQDESGVGPEETDQATDAGEGLPERFSEDSEQFTQTDGEALYRTTCQACHMEDGRGDKGAGEHPPLADNPKLQSKHFVAGVILTGYHGMPGFSSMMSDEQVAAVTNYVRSHFGNIDGALISAEEVGTLRPPEVED